VNDFPSQFCSALGQIKRQKQIYLFISLPFFLYFKNILVLQGFFYILPPFITLVHIRKDILLCNYLLKPKRIEQNKKFLVQTIVYFNFIPFVKNKTEIGVF